jgi:U3 small nucleolar RNA-associated protein 20
MKFPIQVLGLLIEVIKKGFLKHIDCVLPVTRRILQSALHAVRNRQQGFESESIVPLWKEAYYSLVMLEKMIHQFDDLCFAKDLEVNFFVLSIIYMDLRFLWRCVA